MNTATYNSSTVNNLWNLIQDLSLTSTDRHWLADKLTESTVEQSAEGKELVFPKLPKGYKPSPEILAMSCGPLPKGFDVDKELDNMWEEWAR